MKQKTIIANWKSNLHARQIEDWFAKICETKVIFNSGCEIVLAPSAVYLPKVADLAKNLHLPLIFCAQDVSQFKGDSYTGEINAQQLKDYVKYALIGHSERRINFQENNRMVKQKILNAVSCEISPIICVSDKVTEEGLIDNSQTEINVANFLSQITQVVSGLTKIQIGKLIIMYEPSSAISVKRNNQVINSPAKLESIIQMIKKLQTVIPQATFYYGGSVDDTNINSFLNSELISGVVVGGASLDPAKFVKLLKTCHKN